jgi:hypothetical protein
MKGQKFSHRKIWASYIICEGFRQALFGEYLYPMIS